MRVLVDNNYILAVRGVDVLNRLKTEEQFTKSNSMPEQPAGKGITERVQDAAVQQVQDSAGSAAKKAADSQFNSLLEGAK